MALRTYEVYFSTRGAAGEAAAKLDGSKWKGQRLVATVDSRSEGQGRLLVRSSGQLPEWKDFKHLFEEFGTVKDGVMRATAPFMEVRYDSHREAAEAVNLFDGAALFGRTVAIERQANESPRVWVHGLPENIRISVVKDKLAEAGTIRFCTVHSHHGEVRFESAAEAGSALEELQGSELLGYKLSVLPHYKSTDGTKLLVSGFGAGVDWQDLKGHFQQAGSVVFSAVKRPRG